VHLILLGEVDSSIGFAFVLRFDHNNLAYLARVLDMIPVILALVSWNMTALRIWQAV